MERRMVGSWLVVVALGAGHSVGAQSNSDAKAHPGPCAGAEHRQFDFWLGHWQVRTPDGKTAGSNTIERTLDGCVLHESWRGAGGHRGQSYNIYDAARRQWHQTWVDDQGLLLQLDGGMDGGRMLLSGETIDSAGRRIKQRISWERLGRDQVRQLWESSTDGGHTWAVAFDGIYSRVHQ